MHKRYIGDGVYAEFDGYALIVTTENGIAVTNRIVFEPEIWKALLQFVDSIAPKAKSLNEAYEEHLRAHWLQPDAYKWWYWKT